MECSTTSRKEIAMKWKFSHLILAGSVIALSGSMLAPANAADEAQERAELAKALAGAKVTLHSGLQTSASQGKPISAKFEVEDGKLQLSIYTMKGDKFSEAIVDHKTGKVAKTEPITSGEDLTAAKAQSEAMAKANRSRQAAASAAAKENKRHR